MPQVRQRASLERPWVRFGSTALLLVVAATACTHAKTASAPSMSIQMSQGSAVISGGGRSQTVTNRAGVGVGYHVTVAPNSLALLQLGDGRMFQLSEGEAYITGEDRIQLAKGAALGQLTAKGQIDADGVTISSDSGTFRVDSGISATVAVFSGTATMSVPGSTLEIPAFREAAASAGVLPGVAKPLQILAGGDVWDHQFLRDAIDLDNRLANFSGGLDAQLGSATGRDFFRLVIADPVELAHVEPFLSQPRADVLIGVVLANATGRPDPQGAFDQIMGQWLAGESWGVLAMEFHVLAQEVFSGLLAAIRKVGISLTTPVPRIVPIPAATRPPVIALGPKPKTTTPATTPVPAATPNPTPSPTGILNQVLDPVTSLLGGLLNLLIPQTPTATSTPATK